MSVSDRLSLSCTFSVKNFCVVTVKLKNDLKRNKMTVKSEPLFSGSRWSEIHCSQPSKRGYFLPELDLAHLVQQPTVSQGRIFFVPNVIKTGLKTFYKACSCSQNTASELITTWQCLQIDVTGGAQDALRHPTLHLTSSSAWNWEAAGCIP